MPSELQEALRAFHAIVVKANAPERPVYDGLFLDQDESESDWIKTDTWDLFINRNGESVLVESLADLISVLRLGGLPERSQIARLGHLLDLPAAGPMPDALRAEVEEFVGRGSESVLKFDSGESRDYHGRWTGGDPTSPGAAPGTANGTAFLSGGLGSSGQLNSLATRQLVKAEIVRDLARRLEADHSSRADLARALGKKPDEIDYNETVNFVLASWAHTSGDSNSSSLAIQKAVQQEFKTPESHLLGTVDPFNYSIMEKEYQQHGTAYRQVIRHAYEATQESLSKAGVKELTLYRGLAHVEGPQKTQKVEIASAPASSWSASRAVALKFAGHYGTLLTATVPASRILSTARTGIGCLNEQEFVVFDGPGLVASRSSAARKSLVEKYSPDQPRDNHGRWAGTGSAPDRGKVITRHPPKAVGAGGSETGDLDKLASKAAEDMAYGPKLAASYNDKTIEDFHSTAPGEAYMPIGRMNYLYTALGKDRSAYEKTINAETGFISDTNSNDSQHLRQAAAELLGRNMKDEFIDHRESHFTSAADPDIKKGLEADHRLSTEYAKRNYVDKDGMITVYRGVGPDALKPGVKTGDSFDIAVNSLSSWSMDKSLATDFAQNAYHTYFRTTKKGEQAAVISTRVKPEDVYLTSDFVATAHPDVYTNHKGSELVIGSKSPTVTAKIDTMTKTLNAKPMNEDTPEEDT